MDKFNDDVAAVEMPPWETCTNDLDATGSYDTNKFYPETELEFQTFCSVNSCKIYVKEDISYVEELERLHPDCVGERTDDIEYWINRYNDIMTTCESLNNATDSASADGTYHRRWKSVKCHDLYLTVDRCNMHARTIGQV